MKVRFYATFRTIVGGKEADIPVEAGETVQALLDAVLRHIPDLAPLLLDEQGKLSRHVHLFVNGRGAVHLSDGMETRLCADDRVDFFPAVAGG